MKSAILLAAILLTACSYKTDIPLEFPTPAPPPAATPLPKLELRRDETLEKQFAEIAKDAKGKVGVAAVVLETGDAALLDADDRYPMQSVYKLPISMAVMDQVRLDNLALDEQIGVTPDDFVRPGQASPLRDKNPKGGIFTIRELIRLALVESDGTASDVLLRVLGGPSQVQSYLTQIGIQDIKVVNTEKELGQDWQTQYQNWATPKAAVELLRCFGPDLSIENSDAGNLVYKQYANICLAFPRKKTADSVEVSMGSDYDALADFITECMKVSVTGPKRLKGLVSPYVSSSVAHKTGTSGTRDGITAATNDIGIIDLPKSKHMAIAVFVSDSPADEKTREAVIARIAKAAWDRWAH